MGRPRKIRPELEGAVIEPTQTDIEEFSEPDENVTITGLSDVPVHLGDGRKLAKGESAVVPADVAELLISRGQAE